MNWKGKLLNPIEVGKFIYLKMGHTNDMQPSLVDKKALIVEVNKDNSDGSRIGVTVFHTDGSVIDSLYMIYDDEWYVK